MQWLEVIYYYLSWFFVLTGFSWAGRALHFSYGCNLRVPGAGCVKWLRSLALELRWQGQLFLCFLSIGPASAGKEVGVSWSLDFSWGLASSSTCVLKEQGRHSRASSNLGLEAIEHRLCCVLQSMWGQSRFSVGGTSKDTYSRVLGTLSMREVATTYNVENNVCYNEFYLLRCLWERNVLVHPH